MTRLCNVPVFAALDDDLMDAFDREMDHEKLMRLRHKVERVAARRPASNKQRHLDRASGHREV